MNHEIIGRLINFWRRTFFTEPILLLCFILCFIIGLLYNYKKKERLLFLIYFFIGTILFVSLNIIVAFKLLSGKKYIVYYEISNTIFELAEFSAFYYFFKVCLRTKAFKNILKIFFATLLSIIIVFFIGLTFPEYSQNKIARHSLFINVIEFFFLFAMCLAYFYELLTNIQTTSLYRRPSFFIVTSTFFYSVLIIPFFMLALDIFKTSTTTFYILFGCHLFLLATVLFSISKAFLCKTPITT